MKLLHLIPRWVVSEDGILVGSAANSLKNLMVSTSMDFSSEIYTHMDQDMKENLSKLQFDKSIFHIGENLVQPHSVIYGVWFFIRGFFTIIRHRAWQADIIHGHSGYPIYGLLTAITAKILRKPSIHTLYCPAIDSLRVLGRKHMLTRQHISYWSLRSNKKILAISENVKQSIMQIGIPAEKIYVLPPIIDCKIFHPRFRSETLRAKLGANSDEPIILFIGNSRSSKGLDILIKALGILVPDKTPFRFVMTLDDLINEKAEQTLMKFKERINSLNLSNRTHQFSFFPNMPELMASADILVLPFRDTEGPSDYPMALLEGMSSGLPIVSTNAGGIPELIENDKNGLLVEAKNIKALASAIESLLINRRLRHTMGKASREKAEKMFSSGNLAKTISTIYKSLSKYGI